MTPFQDASLIEEVRCLKQQLIESEKEKNQSENELQAAKVKCGKLLQKVKSFQSKNEALQKEVDRLKSMKSGLSDLDQALEEEFKAQVFKAQTEKDELKQRLDEVLREKDTLGQQCEVLKDGHERFIEMKENQDTELRILKSRNRELESSVNSMEWRISELEEALEQQQQSSSKAESTSASYTPSESQGSLDVSSSEMRDRVTALESQLDELSSSNMKVESIKKDLEVQVEEMRVENEKLKQEREDLANQVAKMLEDKSKALKEVETYKEAFIQQQEQFERLTDEKNAMEKSLCDAINSERYVKQELREMNAETENLRQQYSYAA